jgi:hypothetical protein
MTGFLLGIVAVFALSLGVSLTDADSRHDLLSIAQTILMLPALPIILLLLRVIRRGYRVRPISTRTLLRVADTAHWRALSISREGRVILVIRENKKDETQ